MTADRAGDLIPSPLLGNLAPQAQGDFSWVKPGMVAWDWWSGPTSADKPTMERFRRFIDFAAENKFPYFLIDACWALIASGCCEADLKTDITRADPAIDMPALVQYAKDRGVGLLLWVHWKHIEPRMDEVLRTYSDWGIKGIKVDFMERDDQETVAFYERLAKATAAHRLLLDMHGAFPPCPKVISRPRSCPRPRPVAVRLWPCTSCTSARCKWSRTTRRPMSTHRGSNLCREVPTAWDETRFIGGEPDQYIALARRKGKTWYIGLMNDDRARTVKLPLSFLPKGSFTARLRTDGAQPTDIVTSTQKVSNTSVLTLDTQPSGGSVVVVEMEK